MKPSKRYVETDRRSLREPFLELGYCLFLAIHNAKDLGLDRCGLGVGRLLERHSAALRSLETTVPPGLGDLARRFARDLDPYLAEVLLCSKCGSDRPAATPKGQAGLAAAAGLGDGLQRLGIVLGHYVRRYERVLPEVAWVAVGRETAREELRAVLARHGREASTTDGEGAIGPSGTTRPRIPGSRGAAEGERGLPGDLGASAFVEALVRAGHSAQKALRYLKDAGLGDTEGVAARRRPRCYGRLLKAVRAEVQVDTKRFWLEREDGTFEVAGVRLSFEWCKILVALRAADGATFSSDELVKRTDVAGASNIIGRMRRHPVLRTFITPKGDRGWIDMDAPMPPERFLTWLCQPT